MNDWKNNYWKGIVICLLSLVAVFHISAVYLIGDRDYQLTSDDYYEREISYEQRLNKLRAGNAFVWQIREEAGRLALTIKDPNGLPVVLETPQAAFYKPNDAGADQDLLLEAMGPGSYQVLTGGLARGQWKVTIQGRHEEQEVAWQTRVVL